MGLYYLIVAAIGFLVATWVGDRVIQGVAIGIALMVCIYTTEAWERYRRK
jgi:hypothetical protein